jgi:hypothetical protein
VPRGKCDLIGRASEAAKQPSVVPGYPIDRDEHHVPVEIRKLYDEIVWGAETSALQRFDHALFCRRVDGDHGAGPPPGEVRMYAPMIYRKARGGDLGNILVRSRNYMRGDVRARKEIAAAVAAAVGLGPMQPLVR